MSKIEGFFSKINMSWKLVLLLAFICGIVPGFLMVPECLEGTSLRMPGITFEFWVFMGLFISLSCEKPLEAGLKTFVFFLISQPLIYLVQVPFSSMGWQLFGYYPIWGLITLLTFPAGMLANLIKRDAWWSVVILLIPMGILALTFPRMATTMYVSFPKMTLTCIFIVLQLVVFPLLLKGGKRVVAYALIVVMVVVSVAGYLFSDSSKVTTSIGAQGSAPYTLVDTADDAGVSLEGDMIKVTYSAARSGDAFDIPITYKDANGDVYTVTFTKTAESSGTFGEFSRDS